MRWTNKVVWSEGMFLEPQHFQQQDRHVERLVEGRIAPGHPFGWGFTRLALDEAALKLGKIQLRSAAGVLPDGTPFDIPEHDPPPPPIDIPPDTRGALVHLALPLRRTGQGEIFPSAHAEAQLGRYLERETEVGDSQAQADERVPIKVGELNLTLRLPRDGLDAYTTLGCARVLECRPDKQLLLDANYIPPRLAARDDARLHAYLQELQGLLHQRGEALATRLAQPGQGGVAEIADFLLLQTINRNEPVFAHLAEHPLLHPERLYGACLALAGDLATFNQERHRPPPLPAYRHDELETCFPPVVAEIRRSLSAVMEQRAIPIELQDRKYGVRVALIPDPDLVRSASFVLAVNAQMPSDALRARFPTQVKIGPVERIRDLVNLQLPGIGLRLLPVAPREIPYHAGCNYFELERSGELWAQLSRTGGLALHIAGEFPGLSMECWAIRE